MIVSLNIEFMRPVVKLDPKEHFSIQCRPHYDTLPFYLNINLSGHVITIVHVATNKKCQWAGNKLRICLRRCPPRPSFPPLSDCSTFCRATNFPRGNTRRGVPALVYITVVTYSNFVIKLKLFVL